MRRTNLYEPFGIVALEAMREGAPLVVSQTGGLGELVEHGDTGYTVPPGDAAALAGYVVKQLTNRDAAKRMAQSAQKRLARYDSRVIARETLEQYRRLLQDGNGNDSACFG
nr:glycosyltransferase family 4 protein [Paenibacillus sp. VKM B-2647]